MDAELCRHAGREERNRGSGRHSQPVQARDSGSVEISEVSSKNRSYFPDENGEFHDYVELHNASDEEVSLAGWYLSNARESLRRWALPAIVLAPGEYRAIHLSGLNRASDEHMHANFRLPASGAEVYLTEPDGTLTSQVTVPALEADQACSLTESGWTTALAPTPGEANSIAGASAIDARESLPDVIHFRNRRPRPPHRRTGLS